MTLIHALGLAAAIATVVIAIVLALRRGPFAGVRCPSCGYDLRGTRHSVRCPECGAPNAFFAIPRSPFTKLKLRRLLGDIHAANRDDRP